MKSRVDTSHYIKGDKNQLQLKSWINICSWWCNVSDKDLSVMLSHLPHAKGICNDAKLICFIWSNFTIKLLAQNSLKNKLITGAEEKQVFECHLWLCRQKLFKKMFLNSILKDLNWCWLRSIICHFASCRWKKCGSSDLPSNLIWFSFQF